MSKALEMIGALWDAIIGPSDTCVFIGDFKHSTVQMRPTVNGPDVDVGVTSRQIVYRTRFARWWIPDVTKSVYEVVGHAPSESVHLIDPRLLEPVTYPLLCNRLLQWSQYPHMYAIHAYVNRILPHHLPYQVSL